MIRKEDPAQLTIQSVVLEQIPEVVRHPQMDFVLAVLAVEEPYRILKTDYVLHQEMYVVFQRVLQHNVRLLLKVIVFQVHVPGGQYRIHREDNAQPVDKPAVYQIQAMPVLHLQTGFVTMDYVRAV